MAEKKSRIPGFVGPSYVARAGRFDCQRLVNMYLEMDQLGAGKGNEPAVMISTPGLELLQAVGTGPIRAVYTLSNQQLMYVVSGSEVYQLAAGSATPVHCSGTLTTSTGPVSVADNGIDLLMVDGHNGYSMTIGSTALVKVVSPNFYPADVVSFQDGFFLLNRKGTPYFFWSDLYAVTFPGENLAAKSGNSDILIAAYSNNREVHLFGANTMETWWLDGQNAVTPFSRQDGKNSQFGCASPHSIARVGETLVWLGSNAQGGGVVYQLQGGSPVRISTHAVEFAIQGLTSLANAVGYGYQQEGHFFYCLNIPGSSTTWCYDISTEQWHERQTTVKGVIGRHLGQTHCVLNGQHIIGDYASANIYAYNLDCYTDNGGSRYKMRQTPHISESLKRIFFKLFELDCQFGVGLVENGQNPENDVAPRVVLEISNDGGQTWSNPIYASMGRMGQWRYRARWSRLGSSRDRVFRVSITDNVKVQLLSAFIDAEEGMA